MSVHPWWTEDEKNIQVHVVCFCPPPTEVHWAGLPITVRPFEGEGTPSVIRLDHRGRAVSLPLGSGRYEVNAAFDTPQAPALPESLDTPPAGPAV